MSLRNAIYAQFSARSTRVVVAICFALTLPVVQDTAQAEDSAKVEISFLPSSSPDEETLGMAIATDADTPAPKADGPAVFQFSRIKATPPAPTKAETKPEFRKPRIIISTNPQSTPKAASKTTPSLKLGETSVKVAVQRQSPPKTAPTVLTPLARRQRPVVAPRITRLPAPKAVAAPPQVVQHRLPTVTPSQAKQPQPAPQRTARPSLARREQPTPKTQKVVPTAAPQKPEVQQPKPAQVAQQQPQAPKRPATQATPKTAAANQPATVAVRTQPVPSRPQIAASRQQVAPARQQPAPSNDDVRLVQAEVPRARKVADVKPSDPPKLETIGPFEMVGAIGEMTVTRRRSRLLRSQHDIYRTAVVDPSICDIVQFTPREVSLIGKGIGATHVTFWFADGRHEPVTYLVRVAPDPEIESEREKQYEILEEIIAELFPDSKVRLLPMADKLIVQGQAKGAAEAAQILALIRGEAIFGGDRDSPHIGSLIAGRASNLLSQEAAGNLVPSSNIINMLQIPGIQQVALKVKIAELNRSAAREFGVDVDAAISTGSGAGMLLIQSLLNADSTSILGSFDNDKLNFGIHYLQQHGVIRVLSEPTLVTMSGHPASFVAGGEFAVPTVVGVGGASAVSTDFRSFGVVLNFLPVVTDKDRIRLDISPEFSQIDGDLTSSDGTPGLSTRSVTTTVEMREGQTLAIAGLLEDTMEADEIGDLPFLHQIFGTRAVSREETELIILVTPELVHPMEPEAVPPLPGFDVTEPSDGDFFIHGYLEGNPTMGHRSTVWPRLRRRYQSGGTSMISGPFGHGQ